MSEIIQDKTGIDREIFVRFSYAPDGGLIVDAQLRAPDKDTMIAAALEANLMEVVKNSEYVVISPDVYETNEDGQRVLVKHEVGEDRPLPDTVKAVRDVTFSHIGTVELVPAVLDEKGDVIEPAIFSTNHHANLRMQRTMLTKVDEDGYELWKLTTLKWMDYGADTTGNADEVGKRLNEVELLEGIKSMSEDWFGVVA